MDNKTTWMPTDLTDNGTCSRCGGCCSSLLPVSKQDLDVMKKAADAAGFVPVMPDGNNVIYLHCPFLKTEADNKKPCAIYDNRPAVCRHFLCSQAPSDMTEQYLADMNGDVPPEPVNVWSVYNKTGLRANGQDIAYDKASSAVLTCNDGARFQIHVGRPLAMLLENGRYIPASLVLNIYEDAVQIFDAERQKIAIIRYDHITSILTESAILQKAKTSPNRAQRRKNKKKG